MKKYIQLGIILAMFAIGGCGMSGGKEEKTVSGGGTPSQEMPKTAAFQDELTRWYMASPKEVEPGYYLFKSKTGGYAMLFPTDGKIGDFGNERKENFYESLIYNTSSNSTNAETQITYENNSNTKDSDINKKLLSNTIKYQGSYQEITEKDKTIFFAKKETKLEKGIGYIYFSFIKANSGDQALRYISSTICKNEDKICHNKQPQFEDEAIKLMKSISFLGK